MEHENRPVRDGAARPAPDRLPTAVNVHNFPDYPPQERPNHIQPYRPVFWPTEEERALEEERERRFARIARINQAIFFVVHALAILIFLRFGLLALGANPDNPFANFIYVLSYPFVAPFLNLFYWDLRSGFSFFEISSLVAIAVYYLLAWGLTRLVRLVYAPPEAPSPVR